jgi:hypothetical protein
MKAEAHTEIFGPSLEWQEQQMTTKAHDDDVEMPDQDGKMGDQEDEIGDQEDELGGTISFIQVRRLYLRQPLVQLITMDFLLELHATYVRAVPCLTLLLPSNGGKDFTCHF